MIDSPTLLSLADRVESLTGPCRETDREILFAIFPKDRGIILVDGKAWFAELTGGDPHQTGFWPQQGRGHSGACALTAAVLRARSAANG